VIDEDEIPSEVVKSKTRTTEHIKYSCSVCGREVGRDNLKTKRVQFKEMGANGPIVQTRTIAWLCVTPKPDGRSCLEDDSDWQRPRHRSAPGFANTKLAE
jgi:hypothetical protein